MRKVASIIVFMYLTCSATAQMPEGFMPLVLVEGGVFTMGSADWEWTRPVREVTLDSYWIGQFEVTQEQWKEVMGTEPSRFSENLQRPVERVAWFETLEFCNRLSRKEGLSPVYIRSPSGLQVDWEANGYRLPTEAEWEYAARGGNLSQGYSYSGGNSSLAIGWISANSRESTHPVGSKTPNELGLYDMSGNVWEWCWDRYALYSAQDQTNPRGPAAGTTFVIRGGSWDYDVAYCRPVVREHYSGGKSDNIGFRVLRKATLPVQLIENDDDALLPSQE